MIRSGRGFPLRWCLLPLLVLPASPSFSQADPLVQGAGQHSCRQMVELSRSEWNSNRNVAPFYQSWVRGFITGMNVANFARASDRQPVQLEARALRDWISAYCDENPDHDLVTASVKLYYAHAR